MVRAALQQMKLKLIPSVIILGAAVIAAPFLTQEKVETMIRNPLPPESLQQIMQGIYAAEISADKISAVVPGLIVPHHLTASENIARGIQQLKHMQPRTIILISPDHFDRCPTVLCTTHGMFPTALGDVQTANNVIDKLADSMLVTLDANMFNYEHGIAAVLPFIKHFVPNAQIVPIVISTGWFEKKEDMRSVIELILGDAPLVISSDFSHYLPLKGSDEMDAETIDTLFGGNLEDIAMLKNPAQSDCPACLWLVSAIAQDREFFNPEIIMHTNSARILKDETAPETTSHFSIRFDSK